MKRLLSVTVLTGLAWLAAAGHSEAQNRTFGRVVGGTPAPLQKSMTQAQARRLCAQEMRGAREGRAALNQKMSICTRKKMEGL